MSFMGFMHDYWRVSAGAIDGLLGTNFVGNYDAKKNYDLQKANFKWQQAVQQKAWEREDNAVQRRAEDLKAAGINPILAAGQSANSGPIFSTSAPQRETPKWSIAEKLAMAVGIDKTLAEIGVMGATKQNLVEQNNNIKAQNELIKAQTIKTIADATGWSTEEVTFKLFGSGYTYSSKQPNNGSKRPSVVGANPNGGELNSAQRHVIGAFSKGIWS